MLNFCEKRKKELENYPDYPIDMEFMKQIEPNMVNEIQSKCPQARFLMNNRLTFEITLKLVI